jgi:hypothetical protein
MADIPAPGYQAFWTTARKTFKKVFKGLVAQHTDAEEQLRQLHKILCHIFDVAGFPQQR